MSGLMTFPHSQVARPSVADWWIAASEQWEDSFQITEGQRPMRLAGKVVEFVIRPDFNHATLIRKLSSDAAAGGEIRIDDVAEGFVTIIVPQPIVQSRIPPATLRPWKYFIRVLDRGPGFAWRPVEILRGDFYCYPGLG